MSYIIGIIIGLIVGGGAAWALLQMAAQNTLKAARTEADLMRNNAIQEAQNKAKEIELAARQQQLKLREEYERENEFARNNMKQLEQRLNKREDTLDRKLDTLGMKEKHLDDQEARLARREKGMAEKEAQLDKTLTEQRDRLLQISGLSADQAKDMLLKRIEYECRQEAGALVQQITEQAQEEAKEKSRMIVLQAIQRYAAEHTSDHTVSTVTIPSDDMKGRVIGREGRNIRSFEKSTGVDVIIDDTPGVVVVSCFDPVRREIARMSLEKLVQDGRIHPARIEEVVAQTSKEMEEELVKLGKEAVQEANL
ncbi:MAG TPA: Rnase Y domain-containing protein, partial [Tepidisphaeraceae bacterium]|nr:Rnase Y domain-containing protein [Tepidisphaeraceae bacterium]